MLHLSDSKLNFARSDKIFTGLRKCGVTKHDYAELTVGTAKELEMHLRMIP